jgi:hypothetical protein
MLPRLIGGPMNLFRSAILRCQQRIVLENFLVGSFGGHDRARLSIRYAANTNKVSGRID